MVFASAIDTTGSRAFVQAFEIRTGAALWDLELPDPKGIYPDRGAMALSIDGILYAASLGGHVTAVDAIRGTLKWSEQFSGAAYGGAVVVDDLLLAPFGDALVWIDRLTGKERGRYQLGDRLDTAPCASSTAAYVAGEDGVVCAVELASGHELWKVTLDGAFDAAPILRDGVLYAATMSGSVYALDATTGAVRWQSRATVKPIAVSPAVSADGLLYVAADDGSIHIIAADSGNLVRSRKLSNAPLRSSPVCSGNTVFAGADDGNIYSIDADYNVNLAYETTSGARIASAGLALYGDLLVFAATNGVLYVLEAKG
jgi:outer membrane protein assembly factor BamB